MSANDQFEMSRIPIKPLPFRNRKNAQCNEILVDYGEDGNYHIYICHHNDRTKFIDITNLIIKEMLPKAEINANQFQITIEGVKEPTSLQDIINEIFKKYLYPEDENGFNFAQDLDKIFDPTTKTVLLRDSSGIIYLPITTTDNVFDSSGKTIQERLDNMTRLGFAMDYIYCDNANQSTFEFSYPFPNYSDFMEVRIGTTFVDKTRYQIKQEKDAEGNVVGGTLTFLNESIEYGRRIDLLFIFNALAKSDGKYEYMYGGNIANNTISITKLEKVSDSFTLPDSSSVATSKGLYNLYNTITGMMDDLSDSVIWAVDTNNTNGLIRIEAPTFDKSKNFLFNVITKCAKNSSATFAISASGSTYNYTYIYNADGNRLTRGIPANKLIRLLFDKDTGKIYMVNTDETAIKASRYIHDCVDQETTISYDSLAYEVGDLIHVYRNGLRLFSDLDYSIDEKNETITLYVRTEDGERIVFEALHT